ncbi:MAG TPA: acyl-ACP--UDP-N-acetylglucosamine O-acyltransferase [Burkholderiales bacterium]|nr:acyl-ACP--UDP-N-acetylglucosamine O-acyltransferase [Burkholderiales bacterium]
MPSIHATAIVHPGARLGASVAIGPYSIVGEHVEIGEGTQVGSHTIIEGHTRIGRDNRIGSFTALGGPPQDKSHAGDPTRLEIGDRNTIREFCTFNTGTRKDAGVTRVGDDNWIMSYVHLAHDCQIGNRTVLANNTQLAGHCHIGDWAILGGFSGVHQFVRIGAHVMLGGGTMLRQDVPPYVTVAGSPPKALGLNVEGLRRRSFTAEAIAALTEAYRTLYRRGLSLAQAQSVLAEQAASSPEVAALADFLRTATRGIVR